MKKENLGTYTIRKSGNSNYVTIPTSSGLSAGDSVILILEANGDIVVKKQEQNFGDIAPTITPKQEAQEIHDLGYDPLEQKSVGEEEIED